ncbi:uncharacterized protein LOC117181182 [Belonocnema kinseyi]|uniref:uncharacterized protein LOC117181182 n=1 Tax=Belonocnema kinseyi TaxID=2817044 RepID=UPI00143D82A3|nr:uncharacterized protein LOC117181182 [Belonocnema kinseyi]
MPKQERSEAVFAEHLYLVRNAGVKVAAVQTETGVRSDCCLEDSRNFKVSQNKIFDGMHDILLGIGPMTLKLIIHHFVFEERLFSVHYLNGRIFAYSYGRLERKNKPPNLNHNNIRNVKDHSLSQKAMQMWCFLRVFPFLVSEKLPKGHSHMQLLLLLLQIMEIVFAPKVTKSLLPLLAELIKDFLQLFKTLFPNANYINKFHHLTHYTECVLWSGSLRLLWCMGYEKKHSHIKRRGQVVNNFKNCPKTLVRVFQCQQSAMWGFGDVKLHSVVPQGGRIVRVEGTLSHQHLKDLNYLDGDLVFKTKSARVNVVLHANGLYVCLDARKEEDVNLPIFGKIHEIIIGKKSEVFLRTFICETTRFDPNLNAHCIELNSEENVDFRSTTRLADYTTMSTWTEPNSEELLISLLHVLI